MVHVFEATINETASSFPFCALMLNISLTLRLNADYGIVSSINNSRRKRQFKYMYEDVADKFMKRKIKIKKLGQLCPFLNGT